MIEFRYCTAGLAARGGGKSSEPLTVRGYAALFHSPSHGEVIVPGAFDEALREQDDVRFLINHDGIPLARTRNGSLRLSSDATGLRFEADLNPDMDASRSLVSAIKRRDLDQMSFAFHVTEESLSPEGHRQLDSVRLLDVSAVTYPWYEDTTVEASSIDALIKSTTEAMNDHFQNRLHRQLDNDRK